MSGETWNIPWQEFEVALGHKNSFSLRNLNIDSLQRAEVFLKQCGFNLAESSHVKQFEQFLWESLFFIRHVLLTEQEESIFTVPHDILHLDDPRALLLLASSRRPRHRYKRLWACSILKVMYAIANLQFSGRLHILNDARDQILKKIKDVISKDGESTAVSFKNELVTLNKIEWKETKTRNSILLKLLHKPDSMIDEVFDYLGVRFVVKSTAEIPILLKILIESDIMIPHQVVSSRTRNSLLGTKASKKSLHFLKELLSSGIVNGDEFLAMAKNVDWHMQAQEEGNKQRTNMFTNQHYKSLQFTVRHLVRTVNPAFLILDSLTNQIHRYIGVRRHEPWLENMIPAQFANYFPIEIQIMDQESYELAKFGPASHEQYKAGQLKMVRERVLGNLLFFDEERLANQEI